MKAGERVVVLRDRRPSGVVVGPDGGSGVVYVRLDTGTACNFPVDQLVPETDGPDG